MPEQLLLYVNARFVTQPLTGVQRYAFECCLQMKKIMPGIRFLRPPVPQQAWSHELETVPIGKTTGHLWEQLDLPLFMSFKKNSFLLNLCNTAPLFIKKQFITIHDLSFLHCKANHTTFFRLWYQWIIPRIARRALHLFTVSETIKKQLMNEYGLNESHIRVTLNGLGSAFYTNNISPKTEKEKIILSVASRSPRKNTALLIEAFKASGLAARYQLVMIGAHHQGLKISRHASDSSVTNLEHLSDQELMRWYQRAEIFVSLSAYEGFGLPVLEALSMNCKVLCSDIEAYRELYSDYAYFCDVNNLEDVVESLQLISREAHPTVDRNELNLNFSYARSAKDILDTIQHVLQL